VNLLRSLGLATWLAAGSVLLVLLAVGAVAVGSIRLVGDLSDRQALARVQLAGGFARDYLRRMSEDVLGAARVLAERPTLQRLLNQRPDRGIEPVLKRFCEAGNLDVCAITSGNAPIVQTGPTVPWEQVRIAIEEQGERFVLSPADGSPPMWGAVAGVAGAELFKVIVMRVANDRLLREMSDQVGSRVRIVNYASYTAPQGDPFTQLHSAALSDGQGAARRIEDPDVYAASQVVAAPTGEVIALLDVEIPAREFDQAVSDFRRRVWWIAAVVAALAGLAGVLYGRWIAQPVSALRDAAVRIGKGDFTPAVPAAAGLKEIGALAQTMEDMRRNLVELTSTMRRREAEAQAVLSGIVEGVYAVDQERRVRYVNPQAAKLLGREPEQMIGEFCGDVLQPEETNGVRPCERDCPIVAARSTGQARSAEKICRTDGTRRSVVITSAAPVEGRQVQVIRDETELEAVRRARDSVLANISHEFRTPLAAQLASIELLHDGVNEMTGAEQRELFENLERGSLRLMRLIDNLLESVRIEAGQLGIRRQTLALPSVVDDAVEFVRPILAQRHQQVAIDLPETLPELVGDEQRLVQVFVNLLSNASKFAPTSSVVRIGAHVEDGAIQTWVEDEGPGLGVTDPAMLFEQFRRADDREPEAPGLGLGLWIVRSVIERHGGTVRVERTPEERTRFIIRLPVEGPG
jgi:signal transduction histidine kinase